MWIVSVATRYLGHLRRGKGSIARLPAFVIGHLQIASARVLEAGSDSRLFNLGVEILLSNTDVWLAAQGMVVAQGDRAVRGCENIRARMIGRGDTHGTENWTRILAVIRKLQAQAGRRNASAPHPASFASAFE